jgi:hypothetical protein
MPMMAITSRHANTFKTTGHEKSNPHRPLDHFVDVRNMLLYPQDLCPG